jgi:hypothetical protein
MHSASRVQLAGKGVEADCQSQRGRRRQLAPNTLFCSRNCAMFFDYIDNVNERKTA